ncbi:hypothetical protein [Pseudalkalibacillus berkeleyi]|uniref:Uncharacterized protein n=1 Tax=Pseudalkalibacillus berkeleyi TaxID=1069813 RepID=A0ABS9H5H6_9BACL|nr:hypothetical protein [Pseudalkalibacillus berkeleyi]MCF6139199.1 hypothetical protein [Pseudalkalibacillus berkeleyi]
MIKLVIPFSYFFWQEKEIAKHQDKKARKKQSGNHDKIRPVSCQSAKQISDDS